MKSRYIVGDVRGDLPLLKKLVDQIGPTSSDILIFLGSYLGPGSDSKGVVDYILDLREKLSPNNVLCLRGCYEYLFKFAIGNKPDWQTVQLWSQMGGNSVFRSYAAEDKVVVLSTGNNGHPIPRTAEIPLRIPEAHVRFLDESLHQWYEDDIFPYVACHSGGHPLLFGGKLESEEQTVFSDKDWWLQDWRQIPGKTVVFSHYPFKEPFRRKGKLGIDLGAGLGGKLAAFEMFTEKLTIAE